MKDANVHRRATLVVVSVTRREFDVVVGSNTVHIGSKLVGYLEPADDRNLPKKVRTVILTLSDGRTDVIVENKFLIREVPLHPGVQFDISQFSGWSTKEGVMKRYFGRSSHEPCPGYYEPNGRLIQQSFVSREWYADGNLPPDRKGEVSRGFHRVPRFPHYRYIDVNNVTVGMVLSWENTFEFTRAHLLSADEVLTNGDIVIPRIRPFHGAWDAEWVEIRHFKSVGGPQWATFLKVLEGTFASMMPCTYLDFKGLRDLQEARKHVESEGPRPLAQTDCFDGKDWGVDAVQCMVGGKVRFIWELPASETPETPVHQGRVWVVDSPEVQAVRIYTDYTSAMRFATGADAASITRPYRTFRHALKTWKARVDGELLKLGVRKRNRS